MSHPLTKPERSIAKYCVGLVKCVLCCLGLVSLAVAGHEPISGDATDFTLKSHSGENLRLQEYTGQVVLLNFWASWCGPCRQEMPALEALYKKYQHLGFTVLAVNVDEDVQQARSLLSDFNLSFPVLFDTDNAVSEAYFVDAMPTTVMIDKNGQKRFLHRGYQKGYEVKYENEIKQLIREY